MAHPQSTMDPDAATKSTTQSAPAPPPAPSPRWPPIRTPRLLLREYEARDMPAIFALEGSAANARFQSWPPWTRQQAQEYVEQQMQTSWRAERDVVELVVEQGGEVVGRVGARVSRRGVGGRTRVDLWFSVLPARQGEGLATEAVAAFVERVVLSERLAGAGEAAQCGLELELELEIECDPRNTASWRLAQRLGFARHSLTERAWESKGEWVGSLVYRRIVEGSIG